MLNIIKRGLLSAKIWLLPQPSRVASNVFFGVITEWMLFSCCSSCHFVCIIDQQPPHSIPIIEIHPHPSHPSSRAHQLYAVLVDLFIRADFYFGEQPGHSCAVWFIFHYCIWLFLAEFIWFIWESILFVDRVVAVIEVGLICRLLSRFHLLVFAFQLIV